MRSTRTNRALPLAMGIAFLILLFGVASFANSQEVDPNLPSAGAPEIDVPSVLRMGDHVQHVDGIQSGPDDAFCQAMAVPADDIDKWFVCILTTNNCRYCDSLQAKWNATPELTALGNADAAKSWSHFGYWNMADASKAYKFKHVRTSAYPTIIVQPPRSGIYGPPGDIVYQHVGDDLPGTELARQIREAVKLRVAKYPGVTPQNAPQKLGTSPLADSDSGVIQPVVSQPTAVQPIGGSNRFPPLPFDPDGSEGLLPLFPRDQVPEVPPSELLGGGAGSWLSRLTGLDGLASTLWSIVVAILSLSCIAITVISIVVVVLVGLWKFVTVGLPWMVAGWGTRAVTNVATGVAREAVDAIVHPHAAPTATGGAATPDMASMIATAVQAGVAEALRAAKSPDTASVS